MALTPLTPAQLKAVDDLVARGRLAVVPADHYLGQCLACHDPHTGISNPPPVVSHPLERLPVCMTCHGPDGFMARLGRHPEVNESDATCLLCQAPGRGPGRLPCPGLRRHRRTGGSSSASP